MSSFLLDNDPASPHYGDLAVVNNSLQFTSGRDGIRQHLQEKIGIFLGEWFLNLGLGVPYYQKILVKNPRFVVIESDLKAYILRTPGVIGLTSFDIDFDSTNRKGKIIFKAQINDGEDLDFTQEFEV